jgi:hypothetical protein
MNYINQEYKFSDFDFAELRFIGTSSMQSKSIYSPLGRGKKMIFRRLRIKCSGSQKINIVFKYNLQIFCGNVQADCINPIFFC